jgi:hypothetical protein
LVPVVLAEVLVADLDRAEVIQYLVRLPQLEVAVAQIGMVVANLAVAAAVALTPEILPVLAIALQLLRHKVIPVELLKDQ